jgi:hypothetical protein
LGDPGARCHWAIALASVFGLSAAVLIQGLSLIGFGGDVWVARVPALIDDY